MARRRIREEDGTMIWFDTDEEYYEYLRQKEERAPHLEIEMTSPIENKHNNIKSCFYKIIYLIIGLLVFFFLVGYCSRNDENRSASKKEAKAEVKEKKQNKKAKSKKGKKSKKGNWQNDIKPLKTNEVEETSTSETVFEETPAKDDINNREGHLDEKPIEPSPAESQAIE